MHDAIEKDPGTFKLDIKLYARDDVNVGFWMAIGNDNWKSAFIENDDFRQRYILKVKYVCLSC